MGAVAVWYGVGLIIDYNVAIISATLAGLLLYLYGLADNDIVGAKTDTDRPIPSGQISLRAAHIARAICLIGAIGLGLTLTSIWWVVASVLLISIVIYNRTKVWWIMGLCRGLNVLCGGAAAYGALTMYPEVRVEFGELMYLGIVAAVWTIYVAIITKYSEGEEHDAIKKRRVGFLIGAIVYLQIIALLCFQSGIVVLMAVLLIGLCILRRLLPEVSAS